MKAEELFRKLEEEIPLELALSQDKVGFIGPKETLQKDINNVLVLMDFLPQKYMDKLSRSSINYSDFDLIVLHHPPLVNENILENQTSKYKYPLYVIHSNWDIIDGGACDALADCLDIEVTGVLDYSTGLGRLGRLKNGPVHLKEFVKVVMRNLSLEQVNMVNEEDSLIETVALVSGFGLNPEFIKMAYENDVDLYLSGDLTHPGAILAKNLGIKLIDASHHATELPGLYRLGNLIAEFGVEVQVVDTQIPWKTFLKTFY